MLTKHRMLTLLAGGLLSYLRDTYTPLILLGYEETSGTTAADSSGNGNDLSVTTGTATWESGSLALVGNADGQSVELPNAELTLANFPAFSADGVAFGALFEIDANTNCYLFRCGSGPYIQLSTGQLHWFSGSFAGPGWITANGWTGLVMINQTTAGLQDWYLNGLLVSAGTGLANFLSTGSTTLSIDGSGFGSNLGDNFHSLFTIIERTLTAAEHHDIAVRSGMAPAEGHYYYTDIVGNGLDDFCVFHAPLWEEAGSQAIDVSGQENHGTFVGGPTLGQTALGSSSGAVYSVGTNGTQTITAPAATVDSSTSSYTVSLQFQTSQAGAVGLWGMNAGALDYSILWLDTTTGYIKFQVFKTTTAVVTGSSDLRDGSTHRLTARFDQTTGRMDLWVDGAYIGTATQANALGVPVEHIYADTGSVALTGLNGNIQLPAIFNAALPDDWCAFLAGGSAPTTLDASSRVRWTMDETDGTALDSALNNDATYAGNPVYNGGSTTFDGSGDYLETDGQTVSLGGDCTFIMEGSGFASGGVFFVCENPTASQSYTLYGSGTTLSVFDGSIRSTGYTLTGSENDFAMVVSGTSCTVYVDGVATPSSPFTVNTRDLSASYIRLMSNRAGGQQISGTVEHFEAFDKAMSAAEVAAEHARR